MKNNMKFAIEKLVRRTIPGFFLSILFPNKKIYSGDNSRLHHIVFLRPGKLGDLLVATPLFHALKTEIHDLKVSVVCSPYNYVIIQNSPDIDKIRITNFHSVPDIFRCILWITRNNADMVVDLTPGFSRTTSLISRFLQMAKIRTAGMHKGEFSKFFDITTDNQGCHIIDRNRMLLETAVNHCFKDSDFRPIIYSTEKQAETAAEYIKKNCCAGFILGVNLSAGQKERQWSYQNYLNLVKMVQRSYSEELTIILFSHGEQRLWAKNISDQMPVQIAPSTDMLTTAEILKYCNLLFTPDTVFLHLASAANIPVVALYCIGGENLIRWRAYNVLSKELIANDSEDVNEISPEDAFENVKEMVNLLKRKR